MNCERWNEGWKFWPDRNAFALVWDIPPAAREITLPHDAMIEETPYAGSPNGGNTGYRDGGNYTYVKTFFVPEEDRGKRYIFKFEGIYTHAMVYLNQQFAGSEADGYTGFCVDVSDYLRPGAENELRVQVKNAGMTNSRWYSGSGIYRDVYLLRSGPVHIEPDGVQMTTENADKEYAVLTVKTAVVNGGAEAQELTLHTVLRRKEGGEDAAGEDTRFFLRPGERRIITQRITVKGPTLWSEDTPVLYQCETALSEAGSKDPIDTADDTFGIRTLELDAARGLRVNGTTVKLRGACIHHDSGLLGAATYENAHYRQIKRLKEAGFNAIRMSHHPAAPALLRACDALGMYVMDEFTDMWDRAKSDLDYALDFSAWWEKDLKAMVRKDYNHPSVILYSVGNEIPEIGSDAGSATCAQLSALIKALDSTRFTTAGINGIFAAGDEMGQILADIAQDTQKEEKIGGDVNNFMSAVQDKASEIVTHRVISKRLEKACASLDVAGYNYMTARYEPDCTRYPNRVVVGSETYPPEIARNWALVKSLPAVIGDFTWTGWDYIGEAGAGVPSYSGSDGGFNAAFPCQLAYCGDLDLTGFRRPMSYFREIVFGLRSDPYIAVQDPGHYGEKMAPNPWIMNDAVSSWDWRGYEGRPVVVEVYAPGGEAELFLNGRSLGRKPAGPENGFRALFETRYEPGTLRTVSYADGAEAGAFELRTLGEPSVLSIETDYEGEELLYLDVTLRDENGAIPTDRDELLTAQVTGGTLLGFGSGAPKPLHHYQEGRTETWNGRAQMILRKTSGQAMEVKVTSASGKEARFQR